MWVRKIKTKRVKCDTGFATYCIRTALYKISSSASGGGVCPHFKRVAEVIIPSIMAINKSRRRSENLRRRKETLLKKLYELGKYYAVDVALILRQNGRFFTYRSIDIESWPLSIKEIVKLYYLNLYIYTNVKAASFIPYP